MQRRFENWLEPSGDFLFGLDSYKIRRWEFVAGIPYFHFRHRLAEISRQSLADYNVCDYKALLDTRFDSYGNALYAKFKDVNLSDDDFIMPIDDDDWFSSNITTLPDCDVMTWNNMVFQTADYSSFHRWHSVHTFWSSNNYAARLGVLKELDTVELARFLFHHEYGLTYTQNRRWRIKTLQGSPTVYLWHAGSTSAIRNGVSISNQKIPKLPPLVSWADPYYRQFVELYSNIQHNEVCFSKP